MNSRSVPWWGTVSSAASPVVLAGAWMIAASLQPRPYDPVVDAVSARDGATDRWVMTLAFVLAGACRHRDRAGAAAGPHGGAADHVGRAGWAGGARARGGAGPLAVRGGQVVPSSGDGDGTLPARSRVRVRPMGENASTISSARTVSSPGPGWGLSSPIARLHRGAARGGPRAQPRRRLTAAGPAAGRDRDRNLGAYRPGIGQVHLVGPLRA